VDGRCGTKDAALESIEELFGPKAETRDAPSSPSNQPFVGASGSRDATRFDVVITMRRAFALELANSPEAVLSARSPR
jgi:hypothetical protein